MRCAVAQWQLSTAATLSEAQEPRDNLDTAIRQIDASLLVPGHSALRTPAISTRIEESSRKMATGEAY